MIRTSSALAALAAPILAFGLTLPAAGGPALAADQESAAATAREHRGDRPEPSPAATAEPAAAVTGDPVIYTAGDGRTVTGYLARPTATDHPLPGLLVIHEWWGLNDNVRAMTRRLAAEGYVALAVDLYGGEVADTPEAARALMGSVDPQRALQNLEGAREHLAARLGATGDRDDRIGVIGWCFGGGWSLRAALAMGNEIDAAVVYYGQPVTDRVELAKLRAPLLGLFGAEDGSIPVAAVRGLESTLRGLGKQVEIHVYDGAGHAFANPSGTRYVPEAAEAAWRETVAFLAEHLQGGS
jgi:carboxymethylenebutenolidase